MPFLFCFTEQQATGITHVDGTATLPHTVQPAPLSSVDIRRYQRQLEEGFDLPNPQYLQWKESTLSPLPQKDPQSGCQVGACGHPRARQWVACDSCPRWYHLCRDTAKEGGSHKLYLPRVFFSIIDSNHTIKCYVACHPFTCTCIDPTPFFPFQI